MPRPDPIRAVVFDFDGLLADTETAWGLAENEMFSRRGRPYGAEEKSWFLGKAMPDAVAVMADLFEEDFDQLFAELEALARMHLSEEALPMPGAVDLLRLVSGSLPIAVASNTRRDLLDLTFRSSGLTDHIPLSVAGDEVASPKPAPDVYLEACRRLGVDPADAIAFEDSPTGAAAARSAGLYVVAVPSFASVITDADVHLTSLEDPQLKDWFTG